MCLFFRIKWVQFTFRSLDWLIDYNFTTLQLHKAGRLALSLRKRSQFQFFTMFCTLEGQMNLELDRIPSFEHLIEENPNITPGGTFKVGNGLYFAFMLIFCHFLRGTLNQRDAHFPKKTSSKYCTTFLKVEMKSLSIDFSRMGVSHATGSPSLFPTVIGKTTWRVCFTICIPFSKGSS